MATIRFTRQPTLDQVMQLQQTFHFHLMCDFSNPPSSISLDSFPCDLTLDPTRPETWARAVYEAGKRDMGEQFGAFRKVGKTMWFPEMGEEAKQPEAARAARENFYDDMLKACDAEDMRLLRDVLGVGAPTPEGVTQHPARVVDNVQCQVCKQRGDIRTMEFVRIGFSAWFMHRECPKPQQPAPSDVITVIGTRDYSGYPGIGKILVNGIEYRPVT